MKPGDRVSWKGRPEFSGMEVLAVNDGGEVANYRCTQEWHTGPMARIRYEYLPGRYMCRWVQQRYLTVD